MAVKLKLTDLKRKAIVKAATTEFYKSGYEATSMDRIAETANVSKRTVYNHFSNKQALFDAIIDELLHIVFENKFPQYDASLSLKEQLYNILSQELKIFMSGDFIKLARVVTSELIRTPDTANAFWEDIHKKKRATFFWLQDAIDDGRLAITSTEIATRQLSGMLKEFIFWPQILGGLKTPCKDEIDKIIDSSLDIFLTYYEVKK